MAFIEPMHRNKPNITYLLTWCRALTTWLLYGGSRDILEISFKFELVCNFDIMGNTFSLSLIIFIHK